MPDVLDYSSGWPTAAAVKAARFAGTVRYLGTPHSGKNLTPAEAAQHHAAGLPIATVYELGAGWMLGGKAAGQRAAHACLTDADRCGIELRGPFLAADFDVTDAHQLTLIDACLDGAADVLGRRADVYGEHDVIEHCLSTGKAARGWQTRAWSHRKVSGRACLLQQIGYVTVGGVTCDRNTILKPDWGQWPHDPEGEDDPMALFDTKEEFDAAVKAAVASALTFPSAANKALVSILRSEGISGAAGAVRAVADLKAQVAAMAAMLEHGGSIDAAVALRIARQAAREAVDSTVDKDGAPEGTP